MSCLDDHCSAAVALAWLRYFSWYPVRSCPNRCIPSARLHWLLSLFPWSSEARFFGDCGWGSKHSLGMRVPQTWVSWQPHQHLSIIIFLGNSDGDWAVATLKSPKGIVFLFLALLSRCCQTRHYVTKGQSPNVCMWSSHVCLLWPVPISLQSPVLKCVL